MGLYIYKMEVKAEAEVDLSASASVEYRENQSEVRVKQGGEYYRLYQMTVYSYGYVEEADSFAADTGPRLRNLGPEERENLPVITWAEDFSLDVPEDLRLDRIDVYDENGEEVNLLFLLAVLIPNSGLVFAGLCGMDCLFGDWNQKHRFQGCKGYIYSIYNICSHYAWRKCSSYVSARCIHLIL